MRIEKLFALVITTVIGCLQKKMKLKNYLTWPICFSLSNLLKIQHELLVNLKHSLIWLLVIGLKLLLAKSGVDHVGMSDHSLTYIHRKISIPRKQPNIINTRQFKRYNLELYKQDLAKILENQPQHHDSNMLWEDWKRKFLLVADMHAPPVSRRVRSEHAPWLTSEIKKKIYDRDF